MSKAAGRFPDCGHFFSAVYQEFLEGAFVGVELLGCGAGHCRRLRSTSDLKVAWISLLAGLGQPGLSLTEVLGREAGPVPA